MTDKPKRPRDANQLAKFIVDLATGEEPEPVTVDTSGQKRGGMKGGEARSKALTPKERSKIAQKGASARWADKKKDASD